MASRQVTMLATLLVCALNFQSGVSRFSHTAIASNTAGHITTIHRDGIDGKPEKILIVTQNWNPGGNAGVYNAHVVGAWFNSGTWKLYNEDQAALAVGASFNVEAFEPDADHYAATCPSNGPFVLHNPRLDGHPEATFFVTHVYKENPSGPIASVYVPGQYAVSYENGNWSIRGIRTAIPAGAIFHVAIAVGRQVAGRGKVKGNAFPTDIDSLQAIVSATAIYTQGLSPNPFGVYWNGTHHEIFNQDIGAMNDDVRFMIGTGTAIEVPPGQGANITPPITIDPTLLIKGNWDFTEGLRGWTKTGTAFDSQPTIGDNITTSRVHKSIIGGDYWDVPYPIGNKGLPWIGTFEDHSQEDLSLGRTQGDGPTGTLTSGPFTVNKPFISFLISGGNNFSKESLQIEVKEGADWKPSAFLATGRNSEIMYRVVWNTAPIAGKTARIVIRDLMSGTWGHVNVADIKFHDADPSPTLTGVELSPGMIETGDADAPVWGLADLHAHPLANLGFGGNLYVGKPEGPIADALASCEPHHGKSSTDKWFGPAKGFFITVGDVMSALGIILALPFMGYNVDLAKPMLYETDGDLHSGVGYPALMSYRYYNTTHQHMYIDWIKRSYDGGLRLMVAHPVTNNLLANIDPKADRSIMNDKESGDAQIQGIKDLVSHNQSWMEIATTPADARSIIRRNKLCIVLGMEIDNIGNFHASDNITSQQLNGELDRLWNMGVRHMFPIHLADSVFGGSAVYSDMFNFNNLFANHRSLQVDEGAGHGVGYKLNLTASKIRSIPPLSAININFNDGSNWRLGPVADMLSAAEPTISTARSHINRFGLSPVGENGINHLLDMGMLVDIDHMSDKAADRLLTLCEQREKNGIRGYPVASGHSDFRELAWPLGFCLSDNNFGQESQKTRSVCDRIIALGGMVAPITEMMNRQRAPGCPVPADAQGTSKTFAQSLWYASQLPGAYGVGIGTDMAMLGGMGPRFGTDAAPAMTLPGGNPIMPPKYRGANGEEHEITDGIRDGMLANRRQVAAAQDYGVKYDSPIQDYRRYRFFWTYGN